MGGSFAAGSFSVEVPLPNSSLVDQGQSHPGQGVLAHILAFAREQASELLGAHPSWCLSHEALLLYEQSTCHANTHAGICSQCKLVIAW